MMKRGGGGGVTQSQLNELLASPAQFEDENDNSSNTNIKHTTNNSNPNLAGELTTKQQNEALLIVTSNVRNIDLKHLVKNTKFLTIQKIQKISKSKVISNNKFLDLVKDQLLIRSIRFLKPKKQKTNLNLAEMKSELYELLSFVPFHLNMNRLESLTISNEESNNNSPEIASFVDFCNYICSILEQSSSLKSSKEEDLRGIWRYLYLEFEVPVSEAHWLNSSLVSGAPSDSELLSTTVADDSTIGNTSMSSLSLSSMVRESLKVSSVSSGLNELSTGGISLNHSQAEPIKSILRNNHHQVNVHVNKEKSVLQGVRKRSSLNLKTTVAATAKVQSSSKTLSDNAIRNKMLDSPLAASLSKRSKSKVAVKRSTSNPMLSGSRTYVGNYFSNKIGNNSLRREVIIPAKKQQEKTQLGSTMLKRKTSLPNSTKSRSSILLKIPQFSKRETTTSLKRNGMMNPASPPKRVRLNARHQLNRYLPSSPPAAAKKMGSIIIDETPVKSSRLGPLIFDETPVKESSNAASIAAEAAIARRRKRGLYK